jgi:hypothetical protein
MEIKSETRNKDEPKKLWDSPTLTILGSVESLTQGCKNKGLGTHDGMSLNGQPYINTCS